jgi:hypothetical protein
MIKPKIYLDTSAISHLEQPEKPSEQEYTKNMFARIKEGHFDIYVSEIVFEEIDDCPPVKRAALLAHIADIDYKNIIITDEIVELGKNIRDYGVLPRKSVRDSNHIAAAIVFGCDYIVSWNMKHMSNVQVNKDIRHITIDKRYKDILLVPPSMLFKRSDSND